MKKEGTLRDWTDTIGNKLGPLGPLGPNPSWQQGLGFAWGLGLGLGFGFGFGMADGWR